MNTEIQPLINGTSPAQVKRASLHKGWFALVTVVVAIFCVAAIFHRQIGNVFGVKNASGGSSGTWGQIENIDSKYLSKKWQWSQECDDETSITLTLAIKQQNVDKIDEALMAVSDPTSEDYGKHWTYADIHDFLAPHNDAKSNVFAWLDEHGIGEDAIKSITPNGDFVRVTTDIKTANAMLNTQYGYWKHSETGKTHLRVKEDYFVPSEITEYLDFISPTLRFPVESHMHSMELIGSRDDATIKADTTYVTPSTLKDLYGMGEVKGGLSDENVQVVASFLEEWFNDDDLAQFWDFFDITETTVSREPSYQPEGYGSEAELDVQYITSTGEGVQTIVWDIEDDLYFISLLTQIAESDVTPTVVSMSYGGDEQSQGWGYSTRANTEFAKVGLLGISFFASSGDDGAISSDDVCGSFGEYTPSFPASSPYVTAVGGVTGGSSENLMADGSGSTGETAWYYSGGGFSTFFDAKSFQSDAVSDYLTSVDTLPSSERFNAEGAAYPDLSAQSEAYVICYESSYYAVSGTSCSCPSVAGMFSIINDIRLTAGKTRLGWLNPMLYSLYSEQSTYFNDVTEGNNMGCDDDGIAFYANDGWDPITGLGTIKFAEVLDAFYKVGTTVEEQPSVFFY